MDCNKTGFDLQHPHWEKYWDCTQNPKLFAEPPSESAKKAVEIFKEKGITKILELGGGLGRDSLYFAKNGFQVYVLEYTKSGVETIRNNASEYGLTKSIIAIQHDVRAPLPFDKDFFEGCFSHMLYCMAFTDDELNRLSEEIRRVLKNSGLNIYTVRNINDRMYGTGIHKGGNMFEIEGFIINFFDEEMVKLFSKGYQIQNISEFEEGGLPKKLYNVVLQK